MLPLATVGELETHLQRPMDPDVALQALQLASGAVRAFCKWDVSRTPADTLQAEGNATMVLTLPTLHLNAVSAVRVNGVSIDITSPALSWSRRGQLYRPFGWAKFAQIDVDCDHGYDPVPDLVKMCVLDMAARQGSNPQGLASATVGSVSQTYATAGSSDSTLTALHERLLDRYSL